MSCLASAAAERCQLASFILAPSSTLQPFFPTRPRLNFLKFQNTKVMGSILTGNLKRIDCVLLLVISNVRIVLVTGWFMSWCLPKAHPL